MEGFAIVGGHPLRGTVGVSGSKNAALPMMAASILASEPVVLLGVPELRDVDTLALVLGHLGVEVKRLPDGSLHLATRDERPFRAEEELVRRMRASFCVLGPLMARRGKAVVPLPGGCNIGPRPVDLHLQGLQQLGAHVELQHGFVVARSARLRGAEIDLRGPFGSTVTGTANLLQAATLAEGTTRLVGAAREPEIVDLANFLNQLGAEISGHGSDEITIVGRSRLGGGTYQIIPDRIEGATLLCALAATQGEGTVTGVVPDHLTAVCDVLTAMGCELTIAERSIKLRAPQRLAAVSLVAASYPGVPTDVQAQLTAALTLASGRSLIRDDVFNQRFQHLAELLRLGARAIYRGNAAEVFGVRQLTGAEVVASDLRASAALVIAGLAARGRTTVRHIHHLDRGYERLEAKLQQLGAEIVRLHRDATRTPAAQPVG